MTTGMLCPRNGMNYKINYLLKSFLDSLAKRVHLESLMQYKLTWKLEGKGEFSVKSAYWVLVNQVFHGAYRKCAYAAIWKKLWNLKVAERRKILDGPYFMIEF